MIDQGIERSNMYEVQMCRKGSLFTLWHYICIYLSNKSKSNERQMMLRHGHQDSQLASIVMSFVDTLLIGNTVNAHGYYKGSPR